MFSSDKNVPEVYVRESRDFQLWMRLLDIYVNSNRSTFTFDANLIDEDRLINLAERSGWFPRVDLSVAEMKLAIRALPYLRHIAGSPKCILAIMHLCLMAQDIDMTRMPILRGQGKNIMLSFSTENDREVNTDAMYELIRILAPVNYVIDFVKVTEFKTGDNNQGIASLGRAFLTPYVASKIWYEENFKDGTQTLVRMDQVSGPSDVISDIVPTDNGPVDMSATGEYTVTVNGVQEYHMVRYMLGNPLYLPGSILLSHYRYRIKCVFPQNFETWMFHTIGILQVNNCGEWWADPNYMGEDWGEAPAYNNRQINWMDGDAVSHEINAFYIRYKLQSDLDTILYFPVNYSNTLVNDPNMPQAIQDALATSIGAGEIAVEMQLVHKYPSESLHNIDKWYYDLQVVGV